MERFGKSHLDIKFRRIVSAELLSAKKEVIFVIRDFSTISHLFELQWAIQDAAKRGVNFRIYASSYLPGIARKLRAWRCKIYTGTAPIKDQFIVIDRTEIIAFKTPTPGLCGNKYGFITRRGVSKYIAVFRNMARKGRLIKRVTGPDPFDEWLAHPVDLGAKTDGARIDLDMDYGDLDVGFEKSNGSNAH
jgi:hypothetical protein